MNPALEITLSRGVRPDLRVGEQLPLGAEQEGDPVRGSRHRESPDGEGRQHRVGEERGEVDDAPGGPDAADEAGAHQDPRDQESPDGMQARVALYVEGWSEKRALGCMIPRPCGLWPRRRVHAT